ncbi:molybdenum cofactor guanylyltransferase [Kordiimonas lacus]|uniref:MobA-like NTP transferase domain-containing protein n=1 Tax=Kordiimonas lacus TaxID=637679 RepID=A0A1G6UCW2_9PROT|nr:molybdenum cofactor guanylyltransferase [Kordiimonas lacus]SDD39064.1 MobA-like NTP transferase domain-containing protein [Kordiimonas lacus]
MGQIRLIIPGMTETLTTFVLAGGRSSRMGQDKAEIEIDGRRMLDRACDLAAEVGSDRVVVLGRPDHPLGVADEQPFAGPARAIAAYLPRLQKPARILVLPVDMPFLKPNHIKALLANTPGAYFDDMYLPFTALVQEGVTIIGDRIRDLHAAFGVTSIPSDPAWGDALVNINTPAVLAQIAGK